MALLADSPGAKNQTEVTAGDDIVFHLLDPARGEDSNLEPIRIPLTDAVAASTHGPFGPTNGAIA